jgi:N utilization substance protein A
MSKALIAGINQVATDKGLDREVIFEAIEAALISAYKRNYGSVANVTSEVDRVTGEMRVFAEREVVEDVMNWRTEVSLEDAKKAEADAELGDVINVETEPGDFGRIAAQTAKQVILQRIREAERDTVYENFAHRVGETLSSQVRNVDEVSGAITVLLDDKHECLIMRDEQIPGERIRRGDYIRVYVVDVHKSNRGPVIRLSRTHRNLLRRLMEQEIPEVRDGTVEIKAIAREPGARSKVAVAATMPNVDAVGSCVGMRGLRIQNIVNELSGEKIDVVEWSPELTGYISNALSPAKVNNVVLDEKASIKTAIVVVPDRQLSLAIGKEGQNARLAAKLTGWRIDIKSESEALEEGLDRLSQAQSQALTEESTTNILSVAEQILQGEDEKPAILADDALSRAARSLEEVDEGLPTTAEGLVSSELPSFEDALAKAEEAENVDFSVPELPSLPSEDDEDFVPLSFESAIAETSESEDESATEEDDVMSATDLPEVITADMLRARMAQRKEGLSNEEMEVPAELLVGLDEDKKEDEDVEDLIEAEGKAPKASKSSKKGKKKPRHAFEEEDDFSDFF